MESDRFKPEKLPRGLTRKEKLKRGMSYLPMAESKTLIMDDAREKAERSMHGGRHMPAKLHSCPTSDYRRNYDAIRWKRRAT